MPNPHIARMLVCDPLALAIGEALGTKTPLESLIDSACYLFVRRFSTPTLGDNATSSRTSEASVTDHEGVVHTDVPANCAIMEGARYVRNLVVSNDVTAGAWNTNATYTTEVDYRTLDFDTPLSSSWGDYGVLYDDLGGEFSEFREGCHVVARIVLSGTAGETIQIAWDASSISSVTRSITLTETPTCYTVACEITSTATWGPTFYLRRITGFTAERVYVDDIQIQDKTGADDPTIPDDFVSNSGGSGDPGKVGADGIQYFATTNGTTVDANGVVTDGTGTAIDGIQLLDEPGDTNTADYTTDISNWVVSSPGTATETTTQIAGLRTAEVTGFNATWQRVNFELAAGITGTKYVSFYIAAGTISTARLTLRNVDAGDQITSSFTIGGSAPTVTTNAAVGVGEFVAMQPVKNGYRYIFSFYPATDGDSCSIGVGTGTSTTSDSILLAGYQISDIPGSYIPTTSTSSVSRTDYDLSYSLTTPDTEGMLIAQCEMVADHELPPSAAGIVGFSSTLVGRGLYWNPSSSQISATPNGTTHSSVTVSLSAVDSFVAALYWDTDGFAVGVSINDGAWNWDTLKTYPGSWGGDNSLVYGIGKEMPLLYEQVAVYDVNKGKAWIEGAY